jgi:hypothetical protein
MSKVDQAFLLALDLAPPPVLDIQKGEGVEHYGCISTKARQFQRHQNELSSILVQGADDKLGQFLSQDI